MTTCAFNKEHDYYLYRDHTPPDARVISVLPENIPLLVDAPIDEDTFVCSANVLPREHLKADEPETTLAACRSAFDRPVAAGGARILTEAEREAYRLVALVQNAPPMELLPRYFAETISPVIRKHPAWLSGLGFATADTTSWSLACVLGEMCDILRFARARGRMKDRLRKFFRLITSSSFLALRRAIRDGRPITSRGMARILHLSQAWADTPLNLFPDRIVTAIPHAWLYRIVEDARNRYMKDDIDLDEASGLGQYRATLKFLDFIRLMWLQGMGIVEFDPFRFFHDDREAIAFVDYVNRIS